ncbi:Mitochondrial fission process protein 1 [Halocaridina rubra]|uniref:Mitochondrial fission process protein 1 n=1 Tax=Halocaridina rubra TaxID=373956 RepID=A0AAN9A3F2_HALRR
MSEEKEIDIYRDTPVRLLGYANEVGEAFRALTPLWFVRSTYGVASAYVVADTYDKSSKMSKQPGATQKAISHAAVDTLIWQALASVIVPGFTINRVCATSLFTLAKAIPKVPLTTRKWITTAIGLGCIPFIVHPIDSGVHYVMDNSIRNYLELAPRKDE